MIRQRPLEVILREDLEALVTNGVAESRTLDYKQELPGGRDSDRKEFLADVCALANSGGGDLVYGVVEERDEAGKPTGVPSVLEGLAGVENVEALRLTLEQAIRDGIEPRVGVSSQAIAGFSSGPALILRVHPSWAAPHMVTFKGSSRFFARGGSGKYQMDVQQIREAFLLSSRIEETIRGFRDQRLSLIEAGEAPASFPPGPKLVLHSVPFQAVAFGGHPFFDISQLQKASSDIMTALPGSALSYGPNLDGWRVFAVGISLAAQMFRNGALEFVDAEIARQNDQGWHLDAKMLGEEAVRMAGGFLKTHATLGFPPPCVLLVSLLGARDCFLHDERYTFRLPRTQEQGRFDREIGPLPEVLVEDYNADALTLLRPIIDMVSQAAGYDGSPLFDHEGN
jgi:hypothetical protein